MLKNTNENENMFEKIDLTKLKKEDIVVTVRKFSEKLCNEKKFKSNQLRKYYNNLLALKSKYDDKSKKGKDVDINNLMLDLGIFASKVEYGLIKAVNNKKEERFGFEFFKKNIVTLSDKVDSLEKFRNFMTIMEAVVAYFPKTN